jgi:CheY-like chemotaxis protein
MDGFQATREIRRLEGERASLDRAYIIALTGLASDRNEEDALAAGVDKFITKPVQFKQLAEVLKKRESPGLSERGA